MKKFIKKMENIYAAVAMAEGGDAESARDIMREENRKQKRDRVTPRKQLRAPGIKR